MPQVYHDFPGAEEKRKQFKEILRGVAEMKNAAAKARGGRMRMIQCVMCLKLPMVSVTSET